MEKKEVSYGHPDAIKVQNINKNWDIVLKFWKFEMKITKKIYSNIFH